MSHADDSLKELSYSISQLKTSWLREGNIDDKIELHDDYLKSRHILNHLSTLKDNLSIHNAE